MERKAPGMRVVPGFPPRSPLLVALLAALLLGACARLPAGEAHGTPAATVAAEGFAQLSVIGLPAGSAVAVAPDRLLTNAHVVPEGASVIGFRRGDGTLAGEARVIARSDRMDLAVLAVPPGFRPVPVAPAPAAGAMLWAVGAPTAGPALAAGRVLDPAMDLPGHGPGFTAQLGALAGYSGGPALDRQGRLAGIVTALPRPGLAPLLTALSGMDLDGLARGAAGREVFLLSADAAMAEARRLAPFSAP
jgi:S1-C subfamily serine protease